MKHLWIKQSQTQHLMVFFNGWGMDARPVEFLEVAPENDLLMFYDYRNVDIDVHLPPQLQRYESIRVLAWSMGVWAYSQLHLEGIDNIEYAIALNGTCLPIHDKYGIPPGIYQTTIDHFSEAGREKFFRRMCGSHSTFQRFQDYVPNRSLREQQEELIAIQKQAQEQREHRYCYNHVLISNRDKIIPTAHQLHSWKGKVKYTMIDSPHFPFFLWKSWEEVFTYAATD